MRAGNHSDNRSSPASPAQETSHRTAVRKRPSNALLLLRLLGLAAEYKWGIFQVLLLQSLLVALSMATLGMTGLGIDYLRWVLSSDAVAPRWPAGLSPPEHWSPQFVITALSGCILLVAAVTAALKYASAIAAAALSQQVLIRTRTDVYRKLQQLSFHFYDAGESSSIINRAAGDASAVRGFIDGVVVRVIMVLLTLAVYLVYMLRTHVTLTLCCLASTPVLWIGAVVFSRVVQPVYRQASDLGDVMIRSLVENLQGIHVIKGFAREAEQAEKFRKANQDIRDLKRTIFMKVSTFQPVMGLVTQVNMLVLIGYGSVLVIRGELALGAGLFVFANLLSEFANQVGQITNIANSIQSGLVSADRVFEVLDEPLRIVSPPAAQHIRRAEGRIEFSHVTFGFDRDRPVLHDISLRVSPGEFLGITGPVGSGKSTLLSLLMRFYDVDDGSIRLDGHDLRDLDLSDLRQNIGIVFQDSFLFSNTVAANIAFGRPDAGDEQIRQAAAAASAIDFIDELPQGFEAMVGEHGANLSGGQRQRLTLARALLKSPPILLLDDATAAVDAETEHEIRDAVVSARQGRTTILVSNRICTLREADRIVVIRDGRIDAVGRHRDLKANCEYYRGLNELQFADAAFGFQETA
ncbi:MAG: ABC transporter ATP-binding protein [Planctomycetaceae bacterium]